MMIKNDRMMKTSIWLVDAFVGEKEEGNPAGVCFFEKFPAPEVMQKIAAEFGWSETAFVVHKSDNHFGIRWFSPRDEAPLCGHATLAAAAVIWEQKRVTSSVITFNSVAGPLVVKQGENKKITLNFPLKPVTLCTLPKDLKRALGADLSIDSVYRDDTVYLICLNRQKDVEDLEPNLSLLERLDCRAVIVTSPAEMPGYDFVSRYFAPKVGIPEDPACGSAHTRLASFWEQETGKSTFSAYQSSKRGGVFELLIKGDRVFITGSYRFVLEGTLNLENFYA